LSNKDKGFGDSISHFEYIIVENAPNSALMKLLTQSFYLQEDVVGLARQLLGKVIETHLPEGITRARIIETEAYRAPEDRASHAWNNRRTARTETMFQEGGRAYVYLCYGIHHLFNVVTGPEDLPHAILVRGALPLSGFEHISARWKSPMKKGQVMPLSGPGVFSKAMGIHTGFDGENLIQGRIRIGSDGVEVAESEVRALPRVGIDYAGEDAMLLWRFVWEGDWG
jgi:DNA-3-methyladenine glycosylase